MIPRVLEAQDLKTEQMSLLQGPKVGLGGKPAQTADARIIALAQAASRIGDLLMLVTSLVEQTNQLALNATIEAARAGEAKGFAVVFHEVKTLADWTAKAADEISQIAGMQRATQDPFLAIEEISGTIGRISEIAGAIAAAVEEQGAATQAISRNVQSSEPGVSQVATAMTEINPGSTNNTASACSQSVLCEPNHRSSNVTGR